MWLTNSFTHFNSLDLQKKGYILGMIGFKISTLSVKKQRCIEMIRIFPDPTVRIRQNLALAVTYLGFVLLLLKAITSNPYPSALNTST
jgi:hypothetical protein